MVEAATDAEIVSHFGWEWHQPDYIDYQGIKPSNYGGGCGNENGTPPQIRVKKIVVLYGVYLFGHLWDIPQGLRQFVSPDLQSLEPHELRKMPEFEGCFSLFCEVTSFAMPLSWDFWSLVGDLVGRPDCLGMNAWRTKFVIFFGSSIVTISSKRERERERENERERERVRAGGVSCNLFPINSQLTSTQWSRASIFFWFCVRCLTWNSCFQTACAFSKAGSGLP